MKSLAALAVVASTLLVPALAVAADAKKPAGAAASVAAPDADKAKEAPKVLLKEPVTGLLFTRKNGGFLNLRIDGNNFALSFYNAKKEEEKPDLTKAIVRFRRFGRDSRFLLVPGSNPKTLTSTFFVERPYRFTITLLTFKEGSEEADESFVQLYHQPMPGDGEGVPGDTLTPEQAQKVQK